MVDRRCRESEGKVKIEGYMSISDEEAHQQKNALGKREKTTKGKCNDVVRRSYERSPMWYRTNGMMGIGYS